MKTVMIGKQERMHFISGKNLVLCEVRCGCREGKRHSQKERNDWKDPLINVYWYENEALTGNCSARIQPVFHKNNKTKIKLAKLTFMH